MPRRGDARPRVGGLLLETPVHPTAALTHARGGAAAWGGGGLAGGEGWGVKSKGGPCEGPGNFSKLKTAGSELCTCTASPPF